jgi:nitronate monooxygenase
MTLFSEVHAILPKDGPPLLPAGGLAHGGHLAAYLALGAAGAVYGTRFIVSPESLYTDVQRKALLAAKTGASVRSLAFDNARNTLDWPKGIDGRGLRNSPYPFVLPTSLRRRLIAIFPGLVNDFEKGVDPLVLQQILADGMKKSDPDRMVIWSGAGIGLINSSKPAKVSIGGSP